MIPHEDDLRSPIYDLQDWLSQFPSAPTPQSPHGDVLTASTEPQCPECGLNHPEDHPCPEMAGEQTIMPIPDDLQITAYEAVPFKGDKNGPVIECPHCWRLNPDPGHVPYDELRCDQCGENLEGGIPYKSYQEAMDSGTPEEDDYDDDWSNIPSKSPQGDEPRWG